MELFWLATYFVSMGLFVVALWKAVRHFDAIRLNIRPDRAFVVGVLGPLMFSREYLEPAGHAHIRPFVIWLVAMIAAFSLLATAHFMSGGA